MRKATRAQWVKFGIVTQLIMPRTAGFLDFFQKLQGIFLLM